jgi:hypothetical protein
MEYQKAIVAVSYNQLKEKYNNKIINVYNIVVDTLI